MDYLEIAFRNLPEQNDLLIAMLSAEDYDSFEETEEGVKAYILPEYFSEEKLQGIITKIKDTGPITFTRRVIVNQNWNALWESNFEPVLIADRVYVRAPFHTSKPDVQYEIEIEPKMSFGTGHHATTSLMIGEMLNMNLTGKSVLDMGCGSGILAILAAKMNAEKILAVDVDDWACRNAMENCMRNQSQHIIVQKGGVNVIRGMSFDVILANINRNVLLNDMSDYAACLKPNGDLVMSGFMTEDVNLVAETGLQLHLLSAGQAAMNSWMMLHLKKAG